VKKKEKQNKRCCDNDKQKDLNSTSASTVRGDLGCPSIDDGLIIGGAVVHRSNA
jgi:hypothetical protein